MNAKIKEQGSVRLDGRIFKWAYDEADVLEVWNWQYGRSLEQLQGADKEGFARELALKLIDAREDGRRQEPATTSRHCTAEHSEASFRMTAFGQKRTFING